MADDYINSILEYIKDQDGIIIITRCILMELASASGILNQEYILYCQKISESGIGLYVIYEEDIFHIMETCFGTNSSINTLLVWSVRMMRGPVSTITKTLDEDEALNDVVAKGKNLDNRGVYERFFWEFVYIHLHSFRGKKMGNFVSLQMTKEQQEKLMDCSGKRIVSFRANEL
jgi:hypothetical protein